jgi:hypothetical protein
MATFFTYQDKAPPATSVFAGSSGLDPEFEIWHQIGCELAPTL